MASPSLWQLAALMRKDVAALVRRAVSQGWRLDERRGGSILLYSPDGRTIVTLHGTPSDVNWRHCHDAAASPKRIQFRKMTSWLVDIDTPGGAMGAATDLERLAEALDAVRGATGAATSLDTAARSVSASFSVDADDAVAAAALGVTILREAFTRAGLPESAPARVAVERLGIPEAVSA